MSRACPCCCHQGEPGGEGALVFLFWLLRWEGGTGGGGSGDGGLWFFGLDNLV